jgi:hypothetical protein
MFADERRKKVLTNPIKKKNYILTWLVYLLLKKKIFKVQYNPFLVKFFFIEFNSLARFHYYYFLSITSMLPDRKYKYLN